MLEVRSLRASYGALPILHDIDFSLRKGETLALLGRNGVGKTTLLKTLIGLISPSSGEIQLAGKQVQGWKPHRLARAGMAYVPQGRGIFLKLTVEENLRIGLRSHPGKLNRVPDEILDLFPILRERLSQLGGTLSGGQQQQLALARALCGKPDVLLLDEPSEGIQPSIVQQIGDLLVTLNRDFGITVLLVEQNLELVRKTASRGLVMAKGRIADALSRDDLKNDNKVFQSLAH